MNTENRDIFILIESENGKPKESSLELFTAAMTVKAATGGSITAVALGDDTAEAVKQAAAYGADRIIRAEDERLGTYSTCRYTNAMYELIKKYSPDAVMISATPNGKDLAPRLARRLATGITANCTEISADGESGLISWNMPAPGGIMATILCSDTRPQMGTICPGTFCKADSVQGAEVEIIDETAEERPQVRILSGIRPRRSKVRSAQSPAAQDELPDSSSVLPCSSFAQARGSSPRGCRR